MISFRRRRERAGGARLTRGTWMKAGTAWPAQSRRGLRRPPAQIIAEVASGIVREARPARPVARRHEPVRRCRQRQRRLRIPRIMVPAAAVPPASGATQAQRIARACFDAQVRRTRRQPEHDQHVGLLAREQLGTFAVDRLVARGKTWATRRTSPKPGGAGASASRPAVRLD